MSLPSNALLDEAQLELLVYDAFTLAALPPLDERLVAQGALVALANMGELGAMGR
jgi:hypothetical protein